MLFCGKLFSERALFAQEVLDLIDGDTDLLHAVALADGDAVVGRDAVGLVADGVEVERDAVRRADLVLAAVALADRAGLVVVDHEFLGKLVVELHRGTGEHVLLGKRQDRGLEGGECGVEVQHDAHVVVALLVLADDLFIVGVAQDREHAALHAERRLDDVCPLRDFQSFG